MMSKELVDIIAPALVAGLMVAFVHAPLGVEVIKRGIIFIDLAIAQIAGLGLVTAMVFLHEPSWIMIQVFALVFALCGGLFFLWVERKVPAQQEAIIGCSFVLAASLALLLLADHPQGGDEIQHLLSGQILFVSWHDVVIHGPVYLTILAFWSLIPAVRSGLGFYTLFAIAITSSVQIVGVYVVFASLILPALAALKAKKVYRVAWLFGGLSVVSGLCISTWIDKPAGPLLVVTYTIICLAGFFWSTKKHTIIA